MADPHFKVNEAVAVVVHWCEVLKDAGPMKV